MPKEELVRLAAEVVGLALRDRLARIHVDAVSLHSSNRIRSRIPDENVPVFAARRLVNERSKLTLVETLVALEHGGNLTHLHRRLLLRIRLNFENIDGATDARAVRMTDKDAVARDSEAAAVSSAVEVAPAPRSGRGILYRRHRDHPMQMLEVTEEMQFFFKRKGARLGVLFRRERIDVALPVHAHGRHETHGRIERARLAARRILRIIDTLPGGPSHRPDKRNNQEKKNGCSFHHVAPKEDDKQTLEVAPEGIEPPTNGLGNRCSILLSYGAGD